ncbi:NUDIX hydrolase [Sorangium sp. So ce260]|uniref:NUDIX domain-containing protein n=1 Tax=Sorangium sp. So ce260 TaxID=3133291 RepID=UPI003F60DB1E
MTLSSVERRCPIVGVGALLFRADGAVLIGHRIKKGEPASWCLPGGHVDARESFEGAALREIAEETGIVGARRAAAFVLALALEADRTQMTVGVAARVDDAVAATREPEIFDRWIWARLDDLPGPLFPASAALLDAWRGRPAAPGWALYAMTDPISQPQE